MVTPDWVTVALVVVVVLQFVGLVALGVWLIVSRRTLADARRQLRRHRDAAPHRPRRRPVGVAPRAVRTVVHTLQGADSLIRKGIVGSVRSSVEDLAGWARVERPDLARITADGRVVLVFSDIEGSTERNESLGDRAWVKVLERHNDLIERRVAGHQGYVVKNQGDGFMIAFARPDEALRCCVSVQQALRAEPERYDGIRVRIGAHAGSSVRRGDDLFGRDVAMAARIADLADGGEILVSQALRDSVDDADVRFGDPIDVELKGLNGTQTVYAVGIPAGH
ncbi:Uncharacterised protein [Mycolicibacterium vanbaalenii]|uniref:Guanylate cyclase domain-containing protein n=1 Tax=Mycolicibacterium vanbaalenii TaxID=110539 RepID=A0A5S9R263_MYCVN|nr:adenylate/guanylate cyclase domain-containing protein [Mycolicibacterium vanbaalenii]CAA0127912.1 Uncharacterised protein [Mycolicibacterium vanbaalenii]